MSPEQTCVDRAEQDESQRKVDELTLQRRMGDIGRKLLVLSGKGGVGKSTVATNLAVALSRAGKRVGLLDVDIHGPSIPKLMGLEGRKITSHGQTVLPIRVHDNLAVMSIAFVLPRGDEAVIWRGPLKYNVIRQFLKDVAWGPLEYLVVDSPPGTGDEPLSVAQLVGSPAQAVIVTTPQDLAISDVRRCVSFCNELSLPVVGIVENMSGYVCPKCGEHTDIFKAGGGRALAREVNVPLLGRIPIDPLIVAAGDAGIPFIDEHAESESVRVFGDVVRQIMGSGAQGMTRTNQQKTSKDNVAMKIAVPLANGRLSMHFGHCEQFALVEVDEATKEVGETQTLTAPAHEPGLLPRWLHEQGANVIIAGGMGQRAQQLFAQNDIAVVVGAPTADPQTLVADYLSGTLESGENVCDH